MTGELSKTVSICTVWISTAVIFTFGLFKMNADFLFFFLASVMVAGAAIGCTSAIWQFRQPGPSSRRGMNELSQMLITCTIWLSLTMMLTFGLFRMNGDFMFFFVSIAILVGAAAGSTLAIWQSQKVDASRKEESAEIS